MTEDSNKIVVDEMPDGTSADAPFADVFRFVPSPGSERLVIFFSGVHSRNFTGFRLLSDMAVNRLFVRDPKQTWYNGAIPGLSSDPQDLLLRIREISDYFLPKNITVIGSSMGGYAAILFGSLLGAKRVLAFGAQLRLDTKLPNTPSQKVLLHYPDLVPLLADSSQTTRFTLYLGSDELADILHVAGCAKYANVRIECVYGSPHNVMGYLDAAGLLRPLLASYALGSPSHPVLPTISPFVDQVALLHIDHCVTSFYHENFTGAEQACRLAIAKIASLPSLWAFRGKILLAMRRNQDAAIALDHALAMQPASETTHYDRGVLFFRLMQYQDAEKHFREAYRLASHKKLNTYIRLIISLREQEKIRDALIVVAEAKTRYPASFGVLFHHGILLEKIGNLPSAEQSFALALKYAPENVPVIDKLSAIRQLLVTQQSRASAMLAFGDALLVRRIHYYYEEYGARWILNDVAELANNCEVVLLNLETVIASSGSPYAKGDKRPHLYRSHPKLIDLLTQLGCNVATTANNHSIDFGMEALLEQNQRLAQLGIATPGSGNNWEEALSPEYVELENGTIVAIVSVFAFWDIRKYAAGANSPGVFHEPDLIRLREYLSPIFKEARRHAHLLVLSPHWTENWTDYPDDKLRELAYWSIDNGCDAILGHSAHVIQGIEIYRGKPIIYDMGCLLVDGVGDHPRLARSAGFRLYFDKFGFHTLNIIPLKLSSGRVMQAKGRAAEDVRTDIRQLSKQLDPTVTFAKQGEMLVIGFSPAFISLPPASAPTQTWASATPREYRPTTEQTANRLTPPPALPEWVTGDSLALLEQNLEIRAAKIPQLFRIGTGFLLEILLAPNEALKKGRWELRIFGLKEDDTAPTLWDSHNVVGGSANPSQWHPGQLVFHQAVVRLPVRTLTGNYRVGMALYSATEKRYLPLISGKRLGEAGDVLELGSIEASKDKTLPLVCSGLDWNGCR